MVTMKKKRIKLKDLQEVFDSGVDVWFQNGGDKSYKIKNIKEIYISNNMFLFETDDVRDNVFYISDSEFPFIYEEDEEEKEHISILMKGRTEIPFDDLKDGDDIFVITKHKDCGRSVQFEMKNFSPTNKHYSFDDGYSPKTEDCIFYKWTNKMNEKDKKETTQPKKGRRRRIKDIVNNDSLKIQSVYMSSEYTEFHGRQVSYLNLVEFGEDGSKHYSVIIKGEEIKQPFVVDKNNYFYVNERDGSKVDLDKLEKRMDDFMENTTTEELNSMIKEVREEQPNPQKKKVKEMTNYVQSLTDAELEKLTKFIKKEERIRFEQLEKVRIETDELRGELNLEQSKELMKYINDLIKK